jgi:hypothetical protein
LTRERLAAHMAKLAKNPRCEVVTPGNRSSIIPMPDAAKLASHQYQRSSSSREYHIHDALRTFRRENHDQ